jgi:hypothetical protein
MGSVIRHEHPGVNRRREMVFSAPLARCHSRQISTLAQADKRQLPQVGINAQNYDQGVTVGAALGRLKRA